MDNTFDPRIVAIVYEVLNREPSDYADPLAQRLVTDLDGDSLDIVELTMLAEDRLHIEISDIEAEPFASDEGGEGGKTVRDFCVLVQAKLLEKSASWVLAKTGEVVVGSYLKADNGFTCLHAGQVVVAGADEGHLFVPCADGQHFLDGQLGDDEPYYVGLQRLDVKVEH